MQKRAVTAFFLLVAGLSLLFSGDAARFTDLGFSPSGNMYMFAEYGVTDKAYEAYASIYAVDTEKNDFISSGVFKTLPGAKTAGKAASAVYQELLSSAAAFMKLNKIAASSNAVPIYIAAEDAGAGDQIEFRDFSASTAEHPVTYAVRLTSVVEGSGENALSAFYLVIEKRGADGKVLSRKIGGNPKIQRKGVIGYRVNRILTDQSGKNLVFVIEKKVAAPGAASIRYMVETVIL